MERTTIDRIHHRPARPPEQDLAAQLLAEVRAMRQEQSALRHMLSDFCGSYLNAKFPYGDGGGDRWSRRRRN